MVLCKRGDGQVVPPAGVMVPSRPGEMVRIGDDAMAEYRKPVAPPHEERLLELRAAVRAVTGKECEYTSRGLQLWAQRGLLDEMGERQYLEVVHDAEAGLWMTSAEAVRRFLKAVGKGQRSIAAARLAKVNAERRAKALAQKGE